MLKTKAHVSVYCPCINDLVGIEKCKSCFDYNTEDGCQYTDRVALFRFEKPFRRDLQRQEYLYQTNEGECIEDGCI